MTLREWSERHDCGEHPVRAFIPTDAQTGRASGPATGAMVIADFSGPSRTQLWNLSDYLVSSVTGGTIWLIPTNSGLVSRI